MTAIAASVADPALAPVEAPRADSAFRRIARSKAGLAGLITVLLVIGMSLITPLFVDSANPVHADARWQGPGGDHWLGTDYAGRDVLKQVALGGRTILYVGFLAAFITLAIAVILGSVAAYFRGWLDSALLQLTDVVMTIPAVVLLAVVGAFFGLTSPTILAVLLGVITWPVLMRSIRAQALSLKEREFVEAARLQDLGSLRIIFVEIVPNMAGYILINFIIAVTNAMYALVGLYVLGLAPLAGNNWGIMIHQAWTYGAIYIPEGRSFILAPVFAIAIFQLGLVMLTRSLEEIFNPRLSRG